MLIVAIILMSVGGVIAIGNWLTIIQSYRKKQFHSAIPFIGAIFLGGGMFILPSIRPFAWSALILDYGTLTLFLASPTLIREFLSTRKSNLVSEYRGKTNEKIVCLRLFRNAIFTIQLQLIHPKLHGLVNAGIKGTWHRDGNRVKLYNGNESASFDVISDAPKESLRQSSGFPTWEGKDEMSLAKIDLVHCEEFTAERRQT